MKKTSEFRISAIISTAVLVGVSVVSFVSGLKSLSDRIHLWPLILAVLVVIWAVATVRMWKAYSSAMSELQDGQRDGVAPGLGPPRSEADFAKSVRSMIQQRGIKEIDIGGLALRSAYFRKGGEFGDLLLSTLRDNRDLRVRVWLLDPKSHSVKLREMAERGKEDGALKFACLETLETLKDIIQAIWNDQNKRRPEVVLVDKVAIGQQIFRVDNEMLVTLYLQHRPGSEAPTIHLTDKDRWFRVYKKEFEHCYHLHSANVFPPDEDLEKAGQKGVAATLNR